MQKRHSDRVMYFTELADTSRKFYLNYLNCYYKIEKGCKVLEIGCGEGGNLLPFAEIGCKVTGIDQSEERIEQAKTFFQSVNKDADFVAVNFFDMTCDSNEDKYDIILIHDVIEHIAEKDRFFKHIKNFVAEDGVLFWGFPAWQMPFGGHQQIGYSRVSSKLPFIHLLPTPLYKTMLQLFGEKKDCIEELVEIKKCGISVETFEKLMKRNGLVMIDRCLWFINPHYEQKFNLKPRKLNAFISRMRYLRNFFTTSCFYVTKCT